MIPLDIQRQSGLTSVYCPACGQRAAVGENEPATIALAERNLELRPCCPFVWRQQ